MRQEESHLFQGLKRDTHPLRQNNKYLWDAKNIRFTPIDDNTLFSITVEKSTKNIGTLNGSYLGHCVVGNYLVVFTNQDKIYVIQDLDINNATILEGDFNFGTYVKAIGVYEGSNVQKVYWVDGVNQPRVINIVNPKIKDRKVINYDFVPTLDLKESISINREEGSGTFAPGVIQYAFTYYNKYGQESNIFYTSGLHYISLKDRGNSPEDLVSNIFRIKVSNIQDTFDYLRIYSIQRTSLNTTPTVKLLTDIEISKLSNKIATFTDAGDTGKTVDPNVLLFIGGEQIIANTIEQKDNTLFLGNITQVKEKVNYNLSSNNVVISDVIKSIKLSNQDNDKVLYHNTNQLSINEDTSTFKYGETYTLGIQFQHESGKWSEPIYLNKHTVSGIRPTITYDSNGEILKIPKMQITINNLKNVGNGFKKVRPLIVYPKLQDRSILAQGILCPTVFNVGNRLNNAPFAQSSWFLRPNYPYSMYLNTSTKQGDVPHFMHWQSLNGTKPTTSSSYTIDNTSRNVEIQGSVYADLKSISKPESENEDNINDSYRSAYMVDQSILTFHSPDIEFDEDTQNALNRADVKLRIIGLTEFTANAGDIDITTSSPTVGDASGFYHIPITSIYKDTEEQQGFAAGGRSLLAGLFYRDAVVDDKRSGEIIKYETIYGTTKGNKTPYAFMVYPWHRSGSLNNDAVRGDNEGTRTSVLKRKVISNLKYSSHNTYLNNITTFKEGITQTQIFNSNEVSLLKIPAPKNSGLEDLTYYGNIDTAIVHNDNYPIIMSADTSSAFIPQTLISSLDSFNSLKGVGDINKGLKESTEAIRMKYKSTPHAVFALNYMSSENSNYNYPVCLPALNNVNKTTIDSNVYPFWIKKTNYEKNDYSNYTIKKCYFAKDLSTAPNDPSIPNINLQKDYGLGATEVYALYKWVPEQGWVMDKDTMNSESNTQVLYKPEEVQYSSLRFRVTNIGNGPCLLKATEYNDTIISGDDFQLIQGNIGDTTSGIPTYKYSSLYLAELYRDIDDSDKNITEQDYLWFPAGEPKDINNTTVLNVEYGDTWYQRYDCLKTYSYSNDDENSIIEIGSFLCETRINIDGRYDRNRGNSTNLYVNNTNFNLINKIYSQQNNFFNYRKLDEDYYTINNHPNQITWSNQKANLSDVDAYTHITLASSLDLDGTKGDLVDIVNWNNTLFSFQNKAFSQILFNDRVQIPTSDNIPIEISNNYKVEGVRTIAEVGCRNRISIKDTPNALYFVDDLNKTLYQYVGQLNALSDLQGMSIWTKKASDNNIRISYDSKNKDVYFILNNSNEDTLCFSEALNSFTSFYNYNDTVIDNIDGKVLAFKDDSIHVLFEGGDNDCPYYKNLLGEEREAYISFISNDNPTLTKIFDTIEFRASSNRQDDKDIPFDYIEVSNEYQKAITNFNIYNQDLKQKFRVWRANIPRVTDNRIAGSRIRNQWAKIKLGISKNTKLNNFIFHDISVKYTV